MKLTLKDVTCGYWGRAVVSGVSMEVESGEIMCLLGPNGSGKTTLFKTILGLIKPQAGEILFGGENICDWSQARIARVMGYIPQAHTPPFPFKVLDVVLMGRTAHLGIFAVPSPEDKEIVQEAMAALNISHLQDRVYTEISGGERQLVLIARALAQQPQVLIMDEPTSSLDFGNQVMVLSHIKRLAHTGLAIIMASHFPDHALLYASKVMLLKKGQVYSLGRPEETVTEENLKSLYGVDVKIIRAEIPGCSETRVCVPVSRQILPKDTRREETC
ncbi:putative ABC transporter ATP-binding protein [Neomoorella glycerini]|uniref:Putative ABC transporter ATP-binding protein n=1 Tax=Neomoorella glycerini TaxID=55779 RepID=A0A6I5ZW88_9FIRM|nr:ABC transporter ATP-binding protein [Moorella glycerini]QGP93959.1 putative ABC transporter ATP-binding protein [Moorella glycerini]